MDGMSGSLDRAIILDPPFRHFGGKRKVAQVVWRALGNPGAYIEPFAGSLAVLLARPDVGRLEIVNDLDGMIANFWRSVQQDPETVEYYATWPKVEIDLKSRYKYLQSALPDLVQSLDRCPNFCDSKIAGWWLWSHQSSIAMMGRGIHFAVGQTRLLSGSDPGWLNDFKDRLSGVVVMCGDWERLFSRALDHSGGVIGVFFDPPYGSGCQEMYAVNSPGVYHLVWDKAIELGERTDYRVAVCGYDGDGPCLPDGWTEYRWSSTAGALRSRGDSMSNRHRERIWFSPHCLPWLDKQLDFFATDYVDGTENRSLI